MTTVKTIAKNDTVTLPNGVTLDYHPQFRFRPMTILGRLRRRWFSRGYMDHHLYVGDCVCVRGQGLSFLVGSDQQLYQLDSAEEYRDYQNIRITPSTHSVS